MPVALRTMGTPILSAATTIAQALQANPAIGSVLLAHRTACVGCYLARFCTLEEAAKYYDVPLSPFIDELRLAHSDLIVTQGESNA